MLVLNSNFLNILSVEKCFEHSVPNFKLLMKHQQTRQKGIPIITKDVWLNPFLSTFDCKLISICGPTISKRKSQDSSIMH